MEDLKWEVRQTEDGKNWEIGYVKDGFFNVTQGDPVYPTKKQAQEELDKMLRQDAQIKADQRTYSDGIDYVCGIRD